MIDKWVAGELAGKFQTAKVRVMESKGDYIVEDWDSTGRALLCNIMRFHLDDPILSDTRQEAKYAFVRSVRKQVELLEGRLGSLWRVLRSIE